MARVAQDRRGSRGGEDARSAALQAIHRAVDLCRAAMPDAAVEREIHELEVLKSAVANKWPLDDETRRRLDIGAFAAKNIEDWNPKLADALMRLDYEVRQGSCATNVLPPAQIPVASSEARESEIAIS